MLGTASLPITTKMRNRRWLNGRNEGFVITTSGVYSNYCCLLLLLLPSLILCFCSCVFVSLMMCACKYMPITVGILAPKGSFSTYALLKLSFLYLSSFKQNTSNLSLFLSPTSISSVSIVFALFTMMQLRHISVPHTIKFKLAF